MPFIPHTENDVNEMLATIGVSSIDSLFEEIPAELRAKALTQVPDAMTEMQIGRLMQQRAEQDGNYLNFIGAGAYQHHIPAAVRAMSRAVNFILHTRRIKPKPVKALCSCCMNIKP